MRNTLLLPLLFSVSATAQTTFQPPATPAKPVADTLHGTILTDNYRWLEDRDNTETIAWTKAQHDYGINYLSQTQKVHDGIRQEIATFIDMDYEGPIRKIGKRLFQTVKKKGDKQYKIYTLLNGKTILIWDPVQLDTSGSTSTSGTNYSYDGERAAISVQKSGAEVSSTHLIDTRTGKLLFPVLENVTGFRFTKDQQHAYFTKRSKEDIDKQLPLKTYLWKIGTPVSEAVFVGTTEDAKNGFYIYDNRYGDVTFLGESDFYANKLFVKKTGTTEKGVLIYEDKKYSAYPEAIGTKMYIMTNKDAPNYKLMLGSTLNPSSKNWKTLIPEKNTVMSGYVVTKNNIIIQDKKDVQSRLLLYDLNGVFKKQLTLPETGDVSGIGYDREEDSIYLTLSTFTSTPKTFVASPKDFKWRLYYERKLPVDMSNIVGEIKFYYSKDSTRVPVFVTRRKDVKMDGANPVLLTAYGGFQSGITPGYQGFFAPLLNRGVIVVEPGIRGGDEYGERWHQNGMLAKKQNCFDDFYSCAEWLIKEKYTSANNIVAMGGSNGGLLMGAAATQRPDLFKAIVCQVPLLDMIRYQKFLIARYWIPEYGTSDSAADFSWLLRYSPYHNIRKGVNLPPMLVTAGANDTRVDALHAKKFVAALQNNPGQISPVILHIDYNSGHGSGQSTEHAINNWNFTFEYILNQLAK